MRNGLQRILATTTLTLTLGVTMDADAGLWGHTKGWKEEVVLHDGRVLVVERHFNLGGYPTPDAHERALIDQTITFMLPDSNKKISWKTEYKNDVPEPNSLSPLLLDVVGGVPYLATSPAGCIAYNKWGRPNPPYVLFKYADGAWQRISLQEFPAELTRANLMPTPATSLLKPYYTVAAAKTERESGNMSAYAKTILREAVKDGGDSGCPDLIRTGNGWKSIDWFSNQPSLEACLKFCSKEGVSLKSCPCSSIFRGK